MTDPSLTEPRPASAAPDRPASPTDGRAAPASAWSGSLRPLTIGLLLTVTLAAAEALSVSTAMPVVAGELGMLSLYGWVFSAFFLGSLVGIVVAGVLIDRRGLLPPYALGIGLFSVGLLVGGLAPSMPVLVAGRAVQGIGAGAIPTTAYVAIRREYPAGIRPQMFAYLSAAWVVPGLVGPAIAGFVAQHFSWRLVFIGLLPLAVIAAALAVPSLRALQFDDESREPSDPGSPAEPASHLEPHRPSRRADEPDTLAAAGPLRTERPAPGDVRRIGLAVRVAVGAALILAALDSRAIALTALLAAAGLVLGLPALLSLLPVGTLRARRGMPVTVLLRGVLTFGFAGTEAYLPLMLVSVRGTSPAVAGLTLTAATLSWTAGAWLQARWYNRVGAQPLVRIGFLIVAAGILLLLPVVQAGAPILIAVAAWGVTGLGMGLNYPAQTLTVMELAAAHEQGSATAALSLSDVTGTALGTGVGGAILALGTSSGWGQANALLVVFGLMAGVIALGVGLTGRVAATG